MRKWVMHKPTDKLKVLLATTSYPLRKGDVSGVFVARLAEALACDEDLLVLTPASRHCSPAEPNTPPVHCFAYAPRPWQLLAHEPGGIPVALKQTPLLWLFVPVFLLSMFFAVLRSSRKTDIIHANWAMTGLICGLVGKLMDKPVVTTLRGSDVSNLEHSRLKRSILGLAIQLNAKVIAVSTPMLSALHQFFPRYTRRCSHIPNGVDEQLLALSLPTEQNTDMLRLVSIGNLNPLKGNSSIIEALKSLPQSVTLTIVGDGPERASLEKQVDKMGLRNRVFFGGNAAPELIPQILGEHDGLILASHSEGRPNVVVEAMAAGRAVLASRLPGVEELIRDDHNGLLFEPGNPASIALAIQQLLRHPEKCRTLGLAARQTVLDLGLSWTACALQYRQVYQQALGRTE